MRVPAEQKAAMVKAAEADGLDLSTWLRRIALREVGLSEFQVTLMSLPSSSISSGTFDACLGFFRFVEPSKSESCEVASPHPPLRSVPESRPSCR